MANFNARSVNVHQFSMIPRPDVPRSAFRIESGHKTTFDSGYLVPIYVDEVLPGDQFNLKMTAFARMATPIFPLMDNAYMDTFFFFVPNRLVWDNFQRFMGERDPDPDSSIDYIIPQVVTPKGGYPANSVQDYMGLPTVGQIPPNNTVSHSALFNRAYNLIWNEWFRDENLQKSVPVPRGDGPDNHTDYTLLRRGKRHDYFTSCLPWPQKGDSPLVPLGGYAAIEPIPGVSEITTADLNSVRYKNASAFKGNLHKTLGAGDVPIIATGAPEAATSIYLNVPATNFSNALHANLSEIAAFTVNELRLSVQMQKMLERDARGGTRYTEIIRSHFGVTSPDARLQRPEYLGGGSTEVNVSPIAQTSETDGTPLGTLAAVGTAVSREHGFTTAFTEHGMIIGLAAVRADLSYQQGLRRMWSRRTRYDFYFPVFAHLGEQPVLNKEIYVTGDKDSDDAVFGYQERWAEYRYHPSQITGLFRSTTAGTIDGWHLAQRFTNTPTLNSTFIQDAPPFDRVLAVGDEANGKQFIFDAIFSVKATRPMPLYSVPGLVDHF